MSGHCEHENQELRRRADPVTNKTLAYVMQCQRCGSQVRCVSKTSSVVTSLRELPPLVDPTLSQRFWDERFDGIKERREAEREQRRVEYHAYLETDSWRARRRLRLELDEHRCQARLPGCSGKANEVHHLTYAHVGNEPLFDLVSVCSGCHRQITDMDYPNREEDAA